MKLKPGLEEFYAIQLILQLPRSAPMVIILQ